MVICHPAVEFSKQVKSNLHCANNFAIYLVAPQYLDQSIFQLYNAKLGFHPQIKEHYLVVCQKDSKEASSYSITVPEVS